MRHYCRTKKELATLRAITKRGGYISFTPEEKKFILKLMRRNGGFKGDDDGTVLGIATAQLHC